MNRKIKKATKYFTTKPLSQAPFSLSPRTYAKLFQLGALPQALQLHGKAIATTLGRFCVSPNLLEKNEMPYRPTSSQASILDSYHFNYETPTY